MEYQNATKNQLRRLDPKVRTRIFDFLDERVAGESDPYAIGEALTDVWRGHWCYRVGDYRVICRLQQSQLLVMVVRVGHRSEVYETPPEFSLVKELKKGTPAGLRTIDSKDFFNFCNRKDELNAA